MRKAQSTLEYALLITVAVGAFLTIQSYVKRGIQGRLRQATDDIGTQYSPGLSEITEAKTDTYTESQTWEAGAGLAGTYGVDIDGGSATVANDRDIKPLHKEAWPATWTWD